MSFPIGVFQIKLFYVHYIFFFIIVFGWETIYITTVELLNFASARKCTKLAKMNKEICFIASALYVISMLHVQCLSSGIRRFSIKREHQFSRMFSQTATIF